MSMLSPTPRLRPTAVPGLSSETVTSLLGRKSDGLEKFESAAAAVLGAQQAVVVGSARAGLGALLAHAGCRPGDEIIVPSYTAPCVPGFLRALGYQLRIANVCERRLVVTGDTVAAALGPRTRAVIPTHVEGVTAPMAEISQVVPAHVVIIEDAAHAVGAEVDGRPVGSYGNAAIHSFGKGKHINTMFGGLVVTDDPAVAAAVRTARATLPPPSRTRLLISALLELGIAAATHPKLYPIFLHPVIRVFDRFGVDLPTRLFEDEGQGVPEAVTRQPPPTVGRLALRQLNGFATERCRRRAAAFAIREALCERDLRYQEANDPGDHPLFVTLLHHRRDQLRRVLLDEGQDTQPTWMRSIEDDVGRQDPVAQRAEREGLYLPIHVGVTPESVIAALDRALGRI